MSKVKLWCVKSLHKDEPAGHEIASYEKIFLKVEIPKVMNKS
jgi:hypothetical protein